jgi:hypothetical protein
MCSPLFVSVTLFLLLLYVPFMYTPQQLWKDTHQWAHNKITTKLAAVVEALSYEPEGPVRWILLIYFILPGALGPGVYSAPNRNEYQKQKNNTEVEHGWCISMTTLLPPVSPLSRWCWIFNISQPYRPPGPVIEISNNNYMDLVRERTILTEWPPLVGEISANFCG